LERRVGDAIDGRVNNDTESLGCDGVSAIDCVNESDSVFEGVFDAVTEDDFDWERVIKTVSELEGENVVEPPLEKVGELEGEEDVEGEQLIETKQILLSGTQSTKGLL
jgi:hypothetical protein